jgi:ribosomal protein S1
MSDEQAPQTIEEKASNSFGNPAISELQAKMKLKGRVKHIALEGAVIDLGLEKDGLLHISQLGKENVKNVTDVLTQDAEVDVYILAFDPQTRRIDLTLVEQAPVSWSDLKVDQVVKGVVEKIDKQRVFVNIGAEQLASIHVSELAQNFVKDPADVVQVGQEVEALVIEVNRRKKRIDLSLKRLQEGAKSVQAQETYEDEDDGAQALSAFEYAFQRAMAQNEANRSKKRNKKRDKAAHWQDQQEIIERTLRMHDK